jgi:hypothetical protein
VKSWPGDCSTCVCATRTGETSGDEPEDDVSELFVSSNANRARTLLFSRERDADSCRCDLDPDHPPPWGVANSNEFEESSAVVSLVGAKSGDSALCVSLSHADVSCPNVCSKSLGSKSSRNESDSSTGGPSCLLSEPSRKPPPNSGDGVMDLTGESSSDDMARWHGGTVAREGNARGRVSASSALPQRFQRLDRNMV